MSAALLNQPRCMPGPYSVSGLSGLSGRVGENLHVSAIECRGLVKSYAGHQALRGLDLEIPGGAVVGFLGPNGAGKTTAIRILRTVVAPDEGSFSVAGHAGDEATEIRRHIGVLPESSGFSEAQTGEEVLSFHARLHGQSRSQAKDNAERLLGEVGLAERSGTRVTGYSRGMRQRLGIARALVNQPAVVFLDEPTLGLDPVGQQDVLQLIATIAREHGTTVVLTTHLLAEVEEICSRVVILNHGRVVADGTVDELTQQVAAARTARLQVPRADIDRAILSLSSLGELTEVGRAGHGDELLVAIRADVPVDHAARRIARQLVGDDVALLGLEFDRVRLSDAFLALTAAP
jgi:ABC-2 type transport system ATP-binding protein